MTSAPEFPEPAVTAKDVESSERRVAEARERAAHAGLSAARSIEKSARSHEEFANVRDQSVEQGVPDIDVHRESAIRHRQAAADDHELAKAKRQESEADLAMGDG